MVKVIGKPVLLVDSICHVSLLEPFSNPGLYSGMQNLGSRATQLAPCTGRAKVL